jgi:hypothetical protein
MHAVQYMYYIIAGRSYERLFVHKNTTDSVTLFLHYGHNMSIQRDMDVDIVYMAAVPIVY